MLFGTITEQTKLKEKREFGFGIRTDENKRPPTLSTLFANNERPPLSKDKWCTFCNGPHPTIKCSVVTDPESRRKFLPQKGKCFGCLRSSHVSRDCQARCHRCSGKNHAALCSVQHYPEYPITTRRARDSNREQTVSTNLYLTQDVNNECILLQTARANVLMEETLQCENPF